MSAGPSPGAMTARDLEYFGLGQKRGLVREPMLEVGAQTVQEGCPNLCEVARTFGVRTTLGVDISSGPGVDEIFNFELEPEVFRNSWRKGQFSTVAIFNVLEHTFNPVWVLSNAAFCLAPGGALLIVVPSVWPLHDFPRDYVRLMPHWFEAFAARSLLNLDLDLFCWLSQFGIDPVRRDDPYLLPSYLHLGRRQQPFRY